MSSPFPPSRTWLRRYFLDLGAALGQPGYTEGALDRLVVTASTLATTFGSRGCLRHVVDVGAFPGHLSIFAREVLEAERVTALTLTATPRYEEVLEQRGVECRTVDIETEAAPVASGDADAVLFCEVLEHLLAPHAAVGEIARMVGPGGRVVASSPNLAALRNRLRLLVGKPILDPLPRQVDRSQGAASSGRPHVRVYLVSEAEALFAEHGLVRHDLCFAEHEGRRPGSMALIRSTARRAITALLPRLKDTWIMVFRREAPDAGGS